MDLPHAPNAPSTPREPVREASVPAPHFAGRGVLQVQRVNGRSVATRTLARSPLRLLTPRNCPGDAAWVFTSTFGGGLVAGDQIDLDVRIGADATCAIATQASTKVFRALAGETSRQTLTIKADAGATCMALPDPLTCFAGAVFEQRVKIELDETASLVLVDWITGGRRARGERWAFQRYLSRIDAFVGSKLVFRDAILLDQADGPIDGEHRMGRCNCFGTLLVLGKRVESAAAVLLEWAGAQPVNRGEELVFSASPVPVGVVIRVAGARTEEVGRWIRRRLDFVPALLGGDPWARKW
jgi:urease accessory protein